MIKMLIEGNLCKLKCRGGSMDIDNCAGERYHILITFDIVATFNAFKANHETEDMVDFKDWLLRGKYLKKWEPITVTIDMNNELGE